MKEKLMSRKLWLAILSSIVSITVIFSGVGGIIGTITGIIGIVASSISYIISESNIDVAKTTASLEEVKLLVDALKNIGEGYSYDYRTKIANKNGITNYKGTSIQNTLLLKLLKEGKLIKP